LAGTTAEQRLHHCYFYCRKVMLEESGADQWLFIHGRLRFPCEREASLFHSWIDMGGDGIYDIKWGHLTKAQFYAKAGPGVIIDATFTAAEVRRLHVVGRLPHRPALLRTGAATLLILICAGRSGGGS